MIRHNRLLSIENRGPRLDRELYPEAYVEEGPDELTWRMEERGAQKAFFE